MICVLIILETVRGTGAQLPQRGAPCPGHDGLVVTIPRAPLVGKPAQQRGHVGEEALARCRIALRCHLRSQRNRCAGAAIHDLGGDVINLATTTPVNGCDPRRVGAHL